MRQIELIYTVDCPNIEPARQQLGRALVDAGMPLQWNEWERNNPASPSYVRRYGSPTILVDGRDVTGAEPSENADFCRLYSDGFHGLQGVPPVEAIVAAIRQNDMTLMTNSTLVKNPVSRSWFAVVPAVIAALLPNVTCPACWPAYAGLLSALGLPLLMDNKVMLPLTGVFLMIAVGSLAFRGRERRGYGPALVGLAAAIIVIVGKFLAGIDVLMYVGIAMLIASSLWNTWPKRVRQHACPACASSETLVALSPIQKPRKGS